MKLVVVAVVAAFVLLVTCSVVEAQNTTCGEGNATIAIAGSTTVAPIARAWAMAYSELCDVTVTVEEGGSSAGAARVCADTRKGTPVDIGSLSRPFQLDVEVESDYSGYKYKCIIGDTSRTVIQVDVAIDGLTVTMAANGAGAKCVESMGGLTPHQLRWIYSNYTVDDLIASGNWDASSLPFNDNLDSTHLWSELSSSCPAAEIKIAGPDPDSGTYLFFLETILVDYDSGETFGDRPDGYFNSSVDSDIVTYVESDEAVIGFFGYAYYREEGVNRLYAAPIENFAGDFVAPDETTVKSGLYTPLSRRLYMNLWDNEDSLKDTAPFIEFCLSTQGSELAHETGYVTIPDDEIPLMLSRVQDTVAPPPTPASGGRPPTTKSSATAGVQQISPLPTIVLCAAMSVVLVYYV